MKNFTKEDIKELVHYLNRRFSEGNCSLNGIKEVINDYACEHEFVNDIKVEGELCQSEQIEYDYYEWCGVDAVSEEDYDTDYYVIDVSYESGAILVYVAE